jgi:acetylornithine deacetylase/succinyl-diaminopimelate desuccinylase-like protein
MRDDPTAEVTDLLRHLIRNACVNDGSAGSGQETRSVDLLRSELEGPGLEVEVFEPAPGRASLVARIEGSEPSAPVVALMGHTDVVPANPDGWQRDPFGADLVDGEVWGRGAIDMLNLTASMAVATRRLARSGWRPKGTLLYLAVADEEALGTHGAQWLTQHERDAVAADYVITESGGIPMQSPNGIKLPVLVGEKGTYWTRMSVRGTPGHASQPFRTDNALVTAAEVVRRLAGHRPEPHIHETWRGFVEGMGYPADLAGPLLDPDAIDALCEQLPLGMARVAHACTHTTIAPTVVRGGSKINVIPDRVELEIDVRTMPGQTGAEVGAMLQEALGDVAERVTSAAVADDPSSSSPIDTPLWDALSRVSAHLHPGSGLVPFLTAGATDARFFRRLGVPSYGFGLFSERITYEQYSLMFHGDDERVDQESLRLSTELWEQLAKDTLMNPVASKHDR